ncbi:MAG: hypothetical protein LLG97_07390 [Deltaproteobacteria bacterium]|nr:hypothetical protein [Deltaproteobacteria bacterium]
MIIKNIPIAPIPRQKSDIFFKRRSTLPVHAVLFIGILPVVEGTKPSRSLESVIISRPESELNSLHRLSGGPDGAVAMAGYRTQKPIFFIKEQIFPDRTHGVA